MYLVYSERLVLVEITPSIANAVDALKECWNGVLYRRDSLGRLVPIEARRNGRHWVKGVQ